MAGVPQTKETDITALVEMAREEVPDAKVIGWIIERSPRWRDSGYGSIIKALKEAGIEL